MCSPLPSACDKSPPRPGLPKGYPYGYPKHARNLVRENVKKVEERAQPHRRCFNNETHRLQRDIEQLPNPSSFTTRIMQHIGHHPVISSSPPFYRTEDAAGREQFGLASTSDSQDAHLSPHRGKLSASGLFPSVLRASRSPSPHKPTMTMDSSPHKSHSSTSVPGLAGMAHVPVQDRHKYWRNDRLVGNHDAYQELLFKRSRTDSVQHRQNIRLQVANLLKHSRRASPPDKLSSVSTEDIGLNRGERSCFF